jgi:hypothetical protein
MLPKVDIRADGGYVVAPYSMHKSGNSYAWADRAGPDDCPLAVPPDWLMDMLSPQVQTIAGGPSWGPSIVRETHAHKGCSEPRQMSRCNIF